MSHSPPKRATMWWFLLPVAVAVCAFFAVPAVLSGFSETWGFAHWITDLMGASAIGCFAAISMGFPAFVIVLLRANIALGRYLSHAFEGAGLQGRYAGSHGYFSGARGSRTVRSMVLGAQRRRRSQLFLQVSTPLNARVGVATPDILGSIADGLLDTALIKAVPDWLEGLRVTAWDDAWAQQAFADPRARRAIESLLGERAAVDTVVVTMSPGWVSVQHFAVSWDRIRQDTLTLWCDQLLELAEALEALRSPESAAQPTELEALSERAMETGQSMPSAWGARVFLVGIAVVFPVAVSLAFFALYIQE